MMRKGNWSLAVIVVFIVGKCIHAEDQVAYQRAVTAAEFAVEELRKISDSGVYDTLRISNMLSYREEEGLFHDNIILKLELSSPHFKSNKPTETYEVFVMRHKEDGVRSVAIDEFPVMDEDAIEAFWIAKVERRRKEREESFRRMEVEDLLVSDERNPTQQEKTTIRSSLQDKSVHDLLDIIDRSETSGNVASRVLAGRMALDRMGVAGNEFSDEDKAIASLSLRELYAVTMGEYADATDYQVTRAKELLDDALIRVTQRSQV